MGWISKKFLKFCIAGGRGSLYECAYNFDKLVKYQGKNFKKEIKMNGCFDNSDNVPAYHAGRWCFCDSDGCNGTGLTQISQMLFILVTLRFAFL